MSEVVFIQEDLVRVKRDDTGKTVILAWGDPIEVLEEGTNWTRVQVLGRGLTPFSGKVRGKLPTQKKGVFELALVDVQQGDGMVVQTPNGRLLFIDGGDNKLFARYTAARFPGTSEAKPLDVEALIVTHGDADHFAGLEEIVESETHKQPRKQLFLRPKRVYHNGLLKGAAKLSPEKIFGRTVVTPTGRAVVELAGDLLGVNAKRMNQPFRRWVQALRHWSGRQRIEMRRLVCGDTNAFQFLANEGIEVEVFGPIPEMVTDRGKQVEALPLLHEPGPLLALNPQSKLRKFSTAHTINGHSIVLRIRMGNVRFLLAGDLNKESMQILRQKVSDAKLQAEIVKVPHHGSADFDFGALQAMAPVVCLISSGDESTRKEYIHPRATLMGALGRASRGDTSLVFCTELAAFFAYRGPSLALGQKGKRQSYIGFERTTFGIVHVRTDGERVLVFTHSGKETLKEAYRFTVDANHQVRFAPDVDKR